MPNELDAPLGTVAIVDIASSEHCFDFGEGVGGGGSTEADVEASCEFTESSLVGFLLSARCRSPLNGSEYRSPLHRGARRGLP